MNTPTKITVSRIVLIIVMLIGIFTLQIICGVNGEIADVLRNLTLGNSNINLIYFIIAIIFVIASATDWLDGYLARKNNQVTDLGKFLDPVADKLLVNSIIIFLLVSNISFATPGQVFWPLFSAIIIVARDIVVDALRFIAANKKCVIAANYFGKAKTVLQMIAIPLMLINDWPFSYFDSSWGNFKVSYLFVYAATIVSLLSGIIYVVQNIHVFKESIVPDLFKIANEKGVTFGSAESITGGNFASDITSFSGASKVYKGTLVTYATELKNKVIGIEKDLINTFGVVSQEVAENMAKKSLDILDVDFCVSCTGNAGPSVCEDNKPVGRVYICVASKDNCETFELNLKGKRRDIQNQCVSIMIEKLLKKIQNYEPKTTKSDY